MVKGKKKGVSAEEKLRDTLGAPDAEYSASAPVDADLVGRLEQAAEVADFIADLQPDSVKHYVYRLGEDGKKISVGVIDDMPDEVPKAADYGERFLVPGCYFCITEIKYYENGARKKVVKAGAREWVGPDYERRAAQKAAQEAPAPAPAANGRPGAADGLAGVNAALDVVFNFLEKFTDVAQRLRGETPPAPPVDVAALKEAHAESVKAWRQAMQEQQRAHAEELERIRNGAGAAPAPKDADAAGLFDPDNLDKVLDVAAKGMKAFGQVKDLFAPPGGAQGDAGGEA